MGFIRILAPDLRKRIMINIIGTYECKADVKGRVMFPSALKKQLNSVMQEGFVIKRSVFNKCLEIHPISEWNIVEQQLASLSSIRNRNREFVRSIVRYASYVQYDKQGRIIIPDNLKIYASIDKEVSIIGMISKIELWSPEKIKKYDNNQMNIDDFDDLADDISF